MKQRTIETMSKNEERISGILQQLKFTRPVSRIMVYMRIKKTATSRDIKLATDLSQPEISNGTMKLRKMGILSNQSIPIKGKGRRPCLFTLNKSASYIENLMVGVIQKQIKESEKNLEVLKNLISIEKKEIENK